MASRPIPGPVLTVDNDDHPFSSSPPRARSSVVPSVLPYLRRLDIADDMQSPHAHKPPLLTLKLSSPSFLNAQVKDDLSRTPLYTISTKDSNTTLIRSDPWDGSTTAAQITWPQCASGKGKGKEVDGPQLSIREGRWRPVDEFLRPGSVLSFPSRFKIPGYSHALKWKAVGSSYWCTAASAKGPIAILEPSVESMPARIKVFETLHDKYDVRPMLVHHGVSILLLDYLLVSALLLVTNSQEWTSVSKYDARSLHSSSRSKPSRGLSLKSAPVSSSPQWKRILHGDHFFPKRASTLSSHGMSNIPHPTTPTSARQLAKIIHGDPIHPTLRTPSPDFSISDNDESESELETDPEPEEVTGLRIRAPTVSSRAPSPSAESVFYPLTPASAPAHTYLDPSFYVPPVPPVPVQYASSSSSRGESPSLQWASSSRKIRELPAPPKHSYSHRSRSNPPRPRTAPRPVTSPGGSACSDSSGSSVTVDRRTLTLERRPSYDVITRTSSMTGRTLPLPPPHSPVDARENILRHSQSTTRLDGRSDRRTSQYPSRTLPATPTSASRWLGHKSMGSFSEWLASTGSPPHIQESFYDVDTPPPAYSSIDFAAGHDVVPPVPPLPHNI
ncbi:hypothetical protein D9758_006861 [Tetrapyrgos nigripes]|uniref:Uncharacterized protein n=1 Tax=Tetrapyrgos nigripes TaxID=182062 RepID=A0A8H5CY21_9AGAR|nr:hypothetical protein D9758_006861 [Tetrapyrgos nigripes]